MNQGEVSYKKMRLIQLKPLIKCLAGIFERVKYSDITEQQAENQVRMILLSPMRRAYFNNFDNLSDKIVEKYHALFWTNTEFYDECIESIDEFTE